MLSSGDVVDLDLGAPEGREAGFRHPAVVVTAQRILDASPSVIHVVPLTSTIRRFHSEIVLAPDARNGLTVESAAQCQHVRSVSRRRILEVRGNLGGAALAQIRETIAVLLDIP
jgi:mRNA interferase MazF